MIAFVIESWIWYGAVMLVAVGRFISRRMTLGSFKRYQTDDYLMLVILCFYTTLIVTINIVATKNSNLLPPGFDVASLTPEDIQERMYGSKLILVVEQCQCCTVFGAKACLLIFYWRLTTMLWENKAVKILCAYVAFGFTFMEVFYFGVWCRPFYEYWQVPTTSTQCDAATNHLITNAVFNISSDCILLAIALPMFLRMQLPMQKKLPLIGVFSLGIFVILAAVLNKVYSFTDPFGSAWTYWYIRESSTALLVANLPFVWTIWRRMNGLKTGSGLPGAGTVKGQSPEELTGRTLTRTKSKPAVAMMTLHTYPGPSNAREITMNAGAGLEEAEPRIPGVLRLDEMLGESSPASRVDREPVPCTSSPLYLGDSHNASLPRSYMQGTAHSVRSEKELLRRESDDSETQGTPVSSLFPHSISSQRSAGSFL